MAARCSFRPSASPTSTLARRTPAASDSGLSEFVRSRDRALKTLFSSLARTTKSVSCSLARPDRAARSTDARQRPLLICSLARSRSQDPVFLTRSHDEKHVVLTRSSRQGRAIYRRSRTCGLICSLARFSRRSRMALTRRLGLHAEGGHAAGVVLDESGEHPADRC